MFMEGHLSTFLDISLMWASMTVFIMFVGLTTETVFSQKISSTQAFSQVLMILLSMQERLGMPFPSLECELILFQTTARLGLRLRLTLGDPDSELGISARTRSILIGA